LEVGRWKLETMAALCLAGGSWKLETKAARSLAGAREAGVRKERRPIKSQKRCLCWSKAELIRDPIETKVTLYLNKGTTFTS
jgi:hypothetical protein